MKVSILPVYHNTPEYRLPIYSFILYQEYIITTSAYGVQVYNRSVLNPNNNAHENKSEIHQQIKLPGHILTSAIHKNTLYVAGDTATIYIFIFNGSTKMFDDVGSVKNDTLDITKVYIYNNLLISGGLDGILNVFTINNTNLYLKKKVNINEIITQTRNKANSGLVDENIIYGLISFNGNLCVLTVNNIFVFNSNIELLKSAGTMFEGSTSSELYFTKPANINDQYLICGLGNRNGACSVEILDRDLERGMCLMGHARPTEVIAASLPLKFIKNDTPEADIEETVSEIDKSLIIDDSESKPVEKQTKQKILTEILIATSSQDKSLVIWSNKRCVPLMVFKNFSTLPVMHMEFVGNILYIATYDGYLKRILFDEFEDTEKTLKADTGFVSNQIPAWRKFEMPKKQKSETQIKKEAQRVERRKKMEEKAEKEMKELDSLYRPFEVKQIEIEPKEEEIKENVSKKPKITILEVPKDDGKPKEIEAVKLETKEQEPGKQKDKAPKESENAVKSPEEALKVENKTDNEDKQKGKKLKFKVLEPLKDTPKAWKSTKNTFLAIFKNTAINPTKHPIENNSENKSTSKIVEENKKEGLNEKYTYGDFTVHLRPTDLQVLYKNNALYSIKTVPKILCFNSKHMAVYRDSALNIYDLETSKLEFPTFIFRKIHGIDIFKNEILLLLDSEIKVINLRTGKTVHNIELPYGLIMNIQFDSLYYLIIVYKSGKRMYFNKTREMLCSLDSANKDSVFSEECFYESNTDQMNEFGTESIEYEFIKYYDILKMKPNKFKRPFIIRHMFKILGEYAETLQGPISEEKIKKYVKDMRRICSKNGMMDVFKDVLIDISTKLSKRGLNECAEGCFRYIE